METALDAPSKLHHQALETSLVEWKREAEEREKKAREPWKLP